MTDSASVSDMPYAVYLDKERHYTVAPLEYDSQKDRRFAGELPECLTYICNDTQDSNTIIRNAPLVANLTTFLPYFPSEYWMIKDAYFEAQDVLDTDVMEQSVRLIYAYHDALRLRIIRDDQNGFYPYRSNTGWVLGLVDPEESIPFLHIDLSNMPQSEQDACIEMFILKQKSVFNVSTGPVIRVISFNMGLQQQPRLRVLVHHMSVDAYAHRILLKDLQHVYQQLSKGEAVSLPTKTTSFQSWAEHVQRLVFSEETIAGLDYWRSIPWSDLKPLPSDHPRGLITDASLKEVFGSLTKQDTLTLLRKVLPFYRAQLTDVLIAAFALTLTRWSGLELLLIAVMSHGRDLPDMNVMRTIGCMNISNRLVLHLDTTSSPANVVRLIRDQRLTMPHQGKIESWTSAMHWKTLPDELCLSKPHAQFNFLGQHQSGPGSSPELLRRLPTLPVEKDDTAERVPWTDFDCKAIIVDGCFSIQWEYSDILYKRSTVETLSGQYIQYLQSIIYEATQ